MDNKMNQNSEKEVQSLPREAQRDARPRRNRRFSLALLSLFLIAALFGLYHLPSRAAGTGTADDPILIATSGDLIDFRKKVNDGDSYYDKTVKLTADIDLGGSATSPWEPIGLNRFSGVFDGQGHTISGLYVSSDQAHIGLFAKIISSGDLTAEVKNLTVSGDVTGFGKVGLIVGMNENGKITNCTANGKVTGIRYEVGGVVGHNYSKGSGKKATVSNCTANVIVECQGNTAGGVVGWNNAEEAGDAGTATVTNCASSGSVSGDSNADGNSYVGGIVGWNYANGTGTTVVVQNCTSSASVSGTGYNVGGVVGYNNANGDGTTALVQNCAASASVRGTVGIVGGVVGHNYALVGTATVQNCMVSEAIVSSDADEVGGIVGQNYANGGSGNATVTNCTANASVSGTNKIGGVVGWNNTNYYSSSNKVTVSNCASSGSVRGASKVGGVVGYNLGYQNGNAATVQNCASSATVTGTGDEVGGVVGDNSKYGEATAAVTNCGWLNTSAANGIGKSDGATSADVVSYTSAQSANIVVACLPDPMSLTLATGGTGTITLKTYPSASANFSTYITSVDATLVPNSPDIASITSNDNRITVTAGAAPATAAIDTNFHITPTWFHGSFNAVSPDAYSADLFPAVALTVRGVAPVISADVLPNGEKGKAYTGTLSATGTAPITWSVTSGTLPAGLSLDATGKISGTPSAAGTSNFTVTATNIAGTNNKPLSITITPKNVSTLTIKISAQTYTGSAITPELKVSDGATKLVLSADYTVTYANNINAGTATATVTGIGNYTGTKSADFTINRKDFSTLTIEDIPDKTYTGSAITPVPTVSDDLGHTLVLNTDYLMAYDNNINVGIATATITCIGNYVGTKSADFTINPRAITFNIASIPDQTFTGDEITPALTVKDGTTPLVQGTHYTVAYTNNINPGTATATATGQGNYAGSSGTATFEIKGGSPDPDPKPKPVPVKPTSYDKIEDAAKASSIDQTNLRKDPETGEVTVTSEFAREAIKSAGMNDEPAKILPIVTGELAKSGDIAGLMFKVAGSELGAADILHVQAVKILANGTGEKFNMVMKKEDVADKTAAVYEDASADKFASGDITSKDYYLVAYIADGGSFDLDGQKNASVTDPVVLTKASQQHSSGGCNAGLGALAILALIPVVLKRKRK